MSIWNAVGAGVSALAGIFGGKDEPSNPFPTGHQLDAHVRHIVRAAEQNGFNPLTLLGSSVSGVTSGMAAPALSSSSTVSKAFEAVGSFLASYDPQYEKRAQAEYDLVQAQLANLQADTAVRLRSLETPVSSGARNVGASGRPIGNEGGVMRGTATGSWNVNPNNTPSQVMEDQYGGLADVITGGNMVQDILQTKTGVYGPNELGEKWRKQIIDATKEWWDSEPRPVENPALPMGWSPRQLFNAPSLSGSPW